MRPLACLLLCAAVAPAAEPVVSRTFDVAALVTPIPDYLPPSLGKATPAPEPTVARDRVALSADLLRTLEAVAPDTAGWVRLTGTTLTVTHAPPVVERVAAKLAELTDKRDLSVSVECRVLTVPAGFDLGLPADGPRVIDPDRLARVLAAAQGHRRTTILQTPKLTVFDGQRAGLWAGEEWAFTTGVDTVNGAMLPRVERVRTGTVLDVRPTVAADRRAAALEAVFEQAEIDGPVPLAPVTHFLHPPTAGLADRVPVPFVQFVQQPTIARREVRHAATVPDGHTLVLPAGHRTAYTTAPAGLLADVPYLNRLVTSKQPVPEQVVALLTVRVQAGEAAVATAAPATRP